MVPDNETLCRTEKDRATLGVLRLFPGDGCFTARFAYEQIDIAASHGLAASDGSEDIQGRHPEFLSNPSLQPVEGAREIVLGHSATSDLDEYTDAHDLRDALRRSAIRRYPPGCASGRHRVRGKDCVHLI
jgi:hypothetical protein